MNKSFFIGILFGVTTLPLVLKIWLKKYYKNKQNLLLKKRKNQEESCYYDCIFINYNNFECRNHLLNDNACGEQCSFFYLKRLISFIGSAQKTINICMYMLALKSVSEELAAASRRGVKVQFITDIQMAQTDPWKKNERRQRLAGVVHKTQKNGDTLMHHKFCLIDQDDPQLAKMFFGSLNLTTQAMCKNFEVIVFTNNKDTISRFSEEFAELWTEF